MGTKICRRPPLGRVDRVQTTPFRVLRGEGGMARKGGLAVCPRSWQWRKARSVASAMKAGMTYHRVQSSGRRASRADATSLPSDDGVFFVSGRTRQASAHTSSCARTATVGTMPCCVWKMRSYGRSQPASPTGEGTDRDSRQCRGLGGREVASVEPDFGRPAEPGSPAGTSMGGSST